MDDRTFDDLTRNVATGPASRRGIILRLFGGGALAGLATAFRTEEAAAACRLVGQPCSRTNPERQCCSGARCARTASGGRACKCAPGRKDCKNNGRCQTNILTDPENCGDCAKSCPSIGGAKKCFNGACACSLNGVGVTCPTGCACNVRSFEGQNAVCASSTDGCTGTTCEKDTDCPVGSACIEPCNTGQPKQCSQPCT